MFRTPQDLHTFIQIVENKNQPDTSQRQLAAQQSRVAVPDELESRNLQYLQRMGLLEMLGPEDDLPAQTGPQQTLNNYILDEKLSEEEERARKVQLIKDKVFQQKQ